MPKAVAAIRDRGNNEPYSDTNAPDSLEMTIAGATPVNPPSTEIVLWANSTNGLNIKGSTGVTTFISGPPALATTWGNRDSSIVAATTKAFAAANQMIWVQISVPGTCTVTGIRYRKGTGTTAANVIGAIYNINGARLAVSGTVAQGTTASAIVTLPFSAAIALTASVYWLGILGSSTSADFYGYLAAEYVGPTLAATQSSFASPSTFTPPANTTINALANVPQLFTY